MQNGFVAQASSTVVGNFTAAGNGVFGGTLAVNSTTGTSTIASGEGFTVGGSQFAVQQGSGYVGIGSSNPTSPLFVSTTLHGLNELAFVNGNNGNNLAGLFVDGSSNAWWRLYNSSNSETIRLDTAGVSYVDGGNVGIGTTSPDARLTVWGPDTASTSAFVVANSASTTEFAVYDTGNAVLSGGLTQNSDQRLKTNVQPLDASNSLTAIDALNPVSFDWIDGIFGGGQQLGFIAQAVQQVFPQLVSTTSPTALTPDGTLGLNYTGLIAPIIASIQSISHISGDFETNLIAWLGNADNGINDLFAKNIYATNITSDQITATQELCVGSTCVTPAQFQAMVAAASQSGTTPSSSGQGSSSDNSGDPSTAIPDTPPVIQVNGDNPAIVQVGATYNDLGATITGPHADLNLGIAKYLNGVLMLPIQLDTSDPATDTIDYAATDQNGLAATSTRTVIIEAHAESDGAATSTP